MENDEKTVIDDDGKKIEIQKSNEQTQGTKINDV